MSVLEELTDFEPELDRAYVERRVRDWQDRLRALYDDVLNWLPSGWSGLQNVSVPFHEELMQRFGVASAALPVLTLVRRSDRAKLEPRGLWIVGTNGRVDLTNGPKHFLLIDRADSFQPPEWEVTSLQTRTDRRTFTKAVLAEMLM